MIPRIALLAHPLDVLYGLAATPLPPLQEIDGEEMLEPYRSLLVHTHDMTPTLEQFHRSRLLLEVVQRHESGEAYFREVVLRTEAGAPVEFGAIKINLGRFPAAAREEILVQKAPLGRILHEHAIAHASRPVGFLRIASDPRINRALGLSGAHLLFGRRNNLLDGEGVPLAEIVEILPPVARESK